MINDEASKPKTIKSSIELLRQAAENVKSQNFAPHAEHPLLETFAALGNEYTRLNAENEALKSPETKAKEARENAARWAREREQKQLTTAEKKRKLLQALYSKYKPYDVWKLKNEAIPLLFGIAPHSYESSSAELDRAWVIAERAVLAAKLKVLDLSQSPSEWLVVPTDFYLWAQSKGFEIPNEFDLAFGIKRFEAIQHQNSQEAAPKTAKAIEAKTRSKARRIAKIREFKAWIDLQAEQQGYNWRHNSIPDTKQSAYRIFYLLHKDIVKVALATFADDLHGVGIRFESAKKTIFINVLEQLYKNRK